MLEGNAQRLDGKRQGGHGNNTKSEIAAPPSILHDTILVEWATKTILIQRTSKLHDVFYIGIPAINAVTETIPVGKTEPAPVVKREPLIKVTGNILYDVNYRSRIDTPYAENDVYQHTLQTRLDVTYKNQYPFKIYVTTRFSNSSLFRNYTDLNFQFNPSDFKRKVKQKLVDAARRYLASKTAALDSLRRVIEGKKLVIASLCSSLQRPDLTQEIVEARERELFNKLVRRFIADTSLDIGPQLFPEDFKADRKVLDSTRAILNAFVNKASSYKDGIEAQKNKLDSLVKSLGELENRYHKLQSAEELDLATLKEHVEHAKDLTALTEKLHQLNIPDSILPKGYKTLYSIQSFNLGRSIADYSELSVKDLSITGIQVEYNPRYYYAIAVGKVDYRFRDYIVHNHTRSSQYVALARFGKGTRNGNHVFLTYYTGRRQFFNSSIAAQPGSGIPGYRLAGISVEGLYKVNDNISVVAEAAKSTIPYYSLDSLQSKQWMGTIGKFSDRSNEAYSVRLLSFFPKTVTRISGNIQYIGANFQSFSTFTTGASQLRWKAKLEQMFFKKQLTIISSLQQNDYDNPFVMTAYKTSALLASFRANLRIKKWPVITLGYYPSYQLTKVGDDHYSENRYYMLMGSAGYYYSVSGAQLSSYLMYSRFYNESADSGFVYYNSKNLLVSQSLTSGRISLVMNASLSTGTDYNICTLENNGQVAINNIISVGAGVKMIKYSLLPVMQWGYSGILALKIPNLGDIQFTMDKGFIPGINKQLVKNNTGRVIYYKTF